jgi:hypothetical protein
MDQEGLNQKGERAWPIGVRGAWRGQWPHLSALPAVGLHATVQDSRQQPAASSSSSRGSRKQYEPKDAHSADGGPEPLKRVPPSTRTRGAAADRNAAKPHRPSSFSARPAGPCSRRCQAEHPAQEIHWPAAPSHECKTS